jgi:hypothetical protein
MLAPPLPCLQSEESKAADELAAEVEAKATVADKGEDAE